MSHSQSIEANKEAFQKFSADYDKRAFIKVLQDAVAYVLVTFDLTRPRKTLAETETPIDGEEILNMVNALPKGQILGNLLKPGCKIIDFACGSGAITERLAPFLTQGEYIGIDVSEGMLEKFNEAGERIQHEWPNFKVKSLCGDILSNDFADASLVGSADLVFSSMAFHHLHDYNAVADKLKTYVKPGGHIVVLDMFKATSGPSLLSKHSHGHGNPDELSEVAKEHGASHRGIANEEMVQCLTSGCEEVSSARELHLNLWFDKQMVDPEGKKQLPERNGMSLAPCGVVVGVAKRSLTVSGG